MLMAVKQVHYFVNSHVALEATPLNYHAIVEKRFKKPHHRNFERRCMGTLTYMSWNCRKQNRDSSWDDDFKVFGME